MEFVFTFPDCQSSPRVGPSLPRPFFVDVFVPRLEVYARESRIWSCVAPEELSLGFVVD